MIVPEIAGAAASELDDLRAACAGALATLSSSGARHLMVVGSDAETTAYDPPQHGSLRPYGVEVDLWLGPHDATPTSPALPLSLLIGGWLVRQHPLGRPVLLNLQGIAHDAAADECRDVGASCAPDEPWALLAMGDGSSCRGIKAPGYDDSRAAPYDDAVAGALETVDAATLFGLSAPLSAELGVAGRPAWQAAAGAVAAQGGAWTGDLSYYAAPYGVSYFVATWLPAGGATAADFPAGLS